MPTGSAAWVRRSRGRAESPGRGRTGAPGRFEEALHRFAAEVGICGNPQDIEAALIRLARRIAPSNRIEVIRTTGRADGSSEWPGSSGSDSGPDGETVAEGSLAEYPIRCGSETHGLLLLHSPGAENQSRPDDLVNRRLTMACTLAACAFERARLRADWACDDEVTLDGDPAAAPEAPADTLGPPPDVVRDATFLNAVLPFALAQSRRHGEPAALLCVQLDRLARSATCSARRSPMNCSTTWPGRWRR